MPINDERSGSLFIRTGEAGRILLPKLQATTPLFRLECHLGNSSLKAIYSSQKTNGEHSCPILCKQTL